jgi:hypothetical protein
MIVFDNTKSLLYQMVEHQLNSLIKSKKEMAAPEYVRENALYAEEEVFLLQSEIKKTHSKLKCFTFGPVNGIDQATEELTRVLQFVINVGLYLVRNDLAISEEIPELQDNQICIKLSDILYDSIVDLSNNPTVIPSNENHIDHYQGVLDSVVRHLRDILRNTPRELGEHAKQFNFSEALTLYPLLLREVFELTAITWIDNSKDMYDYFMLEN